MADVSCPRCGRLLAKDNGGVLEVIHGKKAVRVYGAVAVALDCDRCGKTLDIARKIGQDAKA